MPTIHTISCDLPLVPLQFRGLGFQRGGLGADVLCDD